jgi:hypothetical protein
MHAPKRRFPVARSMIAAPQPEAAEAGAHEVINGLSICPAAILEDMWAADFERECSDGYAAGAA